MPFFEEKAVLRQINYIKKKFKRVKEETENVVTLLEKCIKVFDQRIDDLVKCNGAGFILLYRKLNSDFEDFQEKLFFIQATVEVPEDPCLPEKVSGETNFQQTDRISPIHSSNVPFSTSGNFEQNDKITPSYSSNVSELPLSSSSSFRSCDTLELTSTNQSTASFASARNASDAYATQSDYATALSVSSNCSSLAGNNFQSNLTTAAVSEFNKCQEQTVQSHKSASFKSQRQSFNGNLSIDSVSQASCYRSLSSDLSDISYQPLLPAGKLHQDIVNISKCSSSNSKEIVLQSSLVPKKKDILPLSITLPMSTTAVLAHIENPGNFWLQLESAKTYLPSFPSEQFCNAIIGSLVEEGDFCLAPSKSVPPHYLRVKVLSKVQTNMQNVEVFFIDHGSSQSIPVKDLRKLPENAYDIPMQAIQCFLSEITAHNNIWCYAAIQKLKEHCNKPIEVHIKTRNGSKYGVQLIATLSVLDEEYSCDIAQSLCLEGFADEIEVPKTEDSTSTKASIDSGVCMASNKLSSPNEPNQLCSSEAIQAQRSDDSLQPLQEHFEMEEESAACSHFPDTKAKSIDLITFDDEEAGQKVNQSAEGGQFSPSPESQFSFNRCLKICTCECPLHNIIPYPSINFVEEDFVLVMLSHIVDPNEFYVNMAMEGATSLDDLLEQMTNTYNSFTAQNDCTIVLDDLKTGMFCAAYFDDGNWYRVKILDIHLKFDQSPNVFVQYVDYGNKVWIRSVDLRMLSSEFTKQPAFSVKCSLAGVVPRQQASNTTESIWTDEAINAFKAMVNFEHCFTAQIVDRATILNDDPLQILLWDTVGKQDFVINQELVEKGIAEFDLKQLDSLLNNQTKKFKDMEKLKNWDPMFEEFNAPQNSYGVDTDDFQVVLSGYKQKDEQYSCKYFALRGYCNRGENCPYEHNPLAEGGATRDKEELASFNSHPPLPGHGSHVLVQVCSVKSPSQFYVQLPFGNLDVDKLDSLINRGAARESLQNVEAHALYKAMNEHYNKRPFDENTAIDLPYGSIVVSRRQHDHTWHRARVIDEQDVRGLTKVFYVDFGNEEWVERKNIRKILPEYMHTPFQAVECNLCDVEPLGAEKGLSWSTGAMSCFKNLVSQTVMLAHVVFRCNDVLQVSLRRTTKDDHMSIKDHLIREGFGQDKLPNFVQQPESKYVPG